MDYPRLHHEFDALENGIGHCPCGVLAICPERLRQREGEESLRHVSDAQIASTLAGELTAQNLPVLDIMLVGPEVWDHEIAGRCPRESGVLASSHFVGTIAWRS